MHPPKNDREISAKTCNSPTFAGLAEWSECNGTVVALTLSQSQHATATARLLPAVTQFEQGQGVDSNACAQ
jgi:hypothetical protein